MGFDPISLLGAAAPILGHAGNAIIDIVKNHFAPDEIRPSNVGEAIQLSDQKIKAFQALNNIGGQTYEWVEAIIKLQRPVVVVGVIATWVFQHTTGAVDTGAVDNAAAIVSSYLFMDRTLFYAKKVLQK